MAVRAGYYLLGPQQGRLALLTARDGLAAQIGHDLTIEVRDWSAELNVNDDLGPTDLVVRIDMNSLVVSEGTGGVKPLTERDRREIVVSARKVLRADRRPEATFTAAVFEPGSNGGGFVQGSLTLAGATRPLRLHVRKTGANSYHAIASVRQSEFGIRPYTAFLGALKVSDSVGIVVDVELPEPGQPPEAEHPGSGRADGAGS
ncbi:MAG TPA: YceI family protein [Streptosporangiaceae bacterium]|nr:YceI family protein [Streptosporangiaceae bacterium]